MAPATEPGFAAGVPRTTEPHAHAIRVHGHGDLPVPRKPPTATAVLIACGWLDPHDANHPGLKIESLSRSHVVTRVIAPDGRAVVLKHAAPEAIASGRNLARECFVYRVAAGVPELASILPRAVWIDERRGLLVLEALGTNASWPSGEYSRITAPGVASRLADAMATWHRITAKIALWPALATGILDVPEHLEATTRGRTPNAAGFLRAIAADPDYCALLREAQHRYRPRTLIHGDLRCDNWIVTRQDAGAQLRVLDWEMSGAGAPEWDVASALVELIVESVRQGDRTSEGPAGWPVAAPAVAGEFLRRYAESGGAWTGREEGGTELIVLFAIARLLHVACEWAESSESTEDPWFQALVARARSLLEQRSAASSALESWVRR